MNHPSEMSVLENPIDYESLEDELHDAIRADALYQLQNDAKIRAVEQGVPTYDQFKDMVSAAHLKPLERGDMKPKLGVRWNSAASCTNSRARFSYPFRPPTISMFEKSPSLSSNNEENSSNIENIEPKTTEDFLQSWKKITHSKRRFDYLTAIRPDNFVEIFRPEIPLGLLGEIMDNFLRNLTGNHDADTAVIDVLTALSYCNRFHLSISFMTEKEKDISEELFRLLLTGSATADVMAKDHVIHKLRKRYQV